MPYSLYVRKSRKDLEAEARGEGETLARHKKILLDLAKKLKFNVTKVYPELVSGETIAARPVMQQLLSDVEQGMWEGVLVVEVERLARGDTIDQGIVAQTFKYSNTKIITPIKTYDPNDPYDEEFFEFGLFMSRREYKTTTRRLQGGRLASVKEGKYVGNIPPYGYTRKKLEKQKGFTLEVNPEQADVVKMIFNLYVNQRFGVSLVVRKLNELRIPPAKGDVWVPASVQTILRNPVYIGKIRWNWRPQKKKMVDGQIVKERPRAKKEDWTLVDGLHKAIIDREIFSSAQELLANNPAHPCPKDMQVKKPLAGLIECGVCGRKMVRRPFTKKESPDVLMCPSTACKNISSHLHLVEERLLSILENWFENYKLNWEQSDDKDNHKDSFINMKKKVIKQLDDELKNLETQSNNIYDLLEQGVYSTDTFLERSKAISNRIATAQKGKKDLVDEITQEEEREENQKLIIPKIEKTLEAYKIAQEPEIKNKLLVEIIEKAVYTKTIKGHRGHPSNDFSLDLYPKIPVKKD